MVFNVNLKIQPGSSLLCFNLGEEHSRVTITSLGMLIVEDVFPDVPNKAESHEGQSQAHVDWDISSGGWNVN